MAVRSTSKKYATAKGWSISALALFWVILSSTCKDTLKFSTTSSATSNSKTFTSKAHQDFTANYAK